jgi:hypothetical protein
MTITIPVPFSTSRAIMITDPIEVSPQRQGENLDIQSVWSTVVLNEQIYCKTSQVGDSIISSVLEKTKSVGPMVGRTLPDACSASVKEKLSLSLSVLIDLSVLFGFKRRSFNTDLTIAHWQLCSVDCGWVKFLKYKLAAFMSSHLGCTLPAKPFACDDIPSQLAGGTLGRFIRLIMSGKRAREFAVGVLYSKKGMPRPDVDALNKAATDTFKVLTTVHSIPTSSYSNLASVSCEVRRTVKEIFKGHRFTDVHRDKPYAPSIKSNYISSRSKFGTFGALLDSGCIPADVVEEKFLNSFYGNALEGVSVSSDERENEDQRPFVVKPAFKKAVHQLYGEIYQKAFVRALEEDAKVSLVSLPEALKVRVISKGPPFTYFVLKPLQKFLHQIMRKFRPFRLLGEPVVTEEYLNEVFSGVSGQFHSLDYTSATDLLNPLLSHVCMDEISDTVELSPDYRKLAIKALVGHEIEVPGTAEHTTEYVGKPQVWGQLMGSIMSFIVLCVINFAVVRYSLEIAENRHYSISDVPCMINGDDGLVRSAPTFYRIWEEVASIAGLNPSLGKTYSHDSYVNINSTSFDLLPSGKFHLIPYVNMGLVNGMTRSGGFAAGSTINKDLIVASLDPHIPTIGARHHSLIKSCPYAMRLRVHSMFLKKNSEFLKDIYVPWYIPEKLGGLGLMPLVNYDYEGDIDSGTRYLDSSRSYKITHTGHVCGPSRRDVIIAWSIRDRSIRTSFPTGMIPSSQPIQARPVWHTRFRAFNTKLSHVKVVDTDATFMDLSTYYLTSSLVMSKLTESSRIDAYKRNERAWVSLSLLMEGVNPSGIALFLDE